MRKDYDPRTWAGFGVSVILGAAAYSGIMGRSCIKMQIWISVMAIMCFNSTRVLLH